MEESGEGERGDGQGVRLICLIMLHGREVHAAMHHRIGSEEDVAQCKGKYANHVAMYSGVFGLEKPLASFLRFHLNTSLSRSRFGSSPSDQRSISRAV